MPKKQKRTTETSQIQEIEGAEGAAPLAIPEKKPPEADNHSIRDIENEEKPWERYGIHLGRLGSLVASICPPPTIPPLIQPSPPTVEPMSTSKQLFFENDPRMEWLPKYVIGNTKKVVSRINIWITGGHLSLDFNPEDVLALARRGGPGMTQAWFTPSVIVEAASGRIVQERDPDHGGRRQLKGGLRPSKKSPIKGIARLMEVCSWEGVQLEIDNDLIRVRVGGNYKDFTYDELGIGRGRSTKDINRARRILMLLAATNKSGKTYIPSEDDYYAGARGAKRFSTTLTRLNCALRKSFGLENNPVVLDGKSGELHTSFIIKVLGEDLDDDLDQTRVSEDKGAAVYRSKVAGSIKEAERLEVEKIARKKNRH